MLTFKGKEEQYLYTTCSLFSSVSFSFLQTSAGFGPFSESPM